MIRHHGAFRQLKRLSRSSLSFYLASPFHFNSEIQGKMKALVVIFTFAAVSAGCVTRHVRHTIVVPPIVVNVATPSPDQKDTRFGDWLVEKTFGPDTAAGEIWAGCVGYYTLAARWPKSREEVEEGLAKASGGVRGLSHVDSIELLEESDALSVQFTGIDGSRGNLFLRPPNQNQPNKAPEPTPGSVTPRATEVKSK